MIKRVFVVLWRVNFVGYEWGKNLEDLYVILIIRKWGKEGVKVFDYRIGWDCFVDWILWVFCDCLNVLFYLLVI